MHGKFGYWTDTYHDKGVYLLSINAKHDYNFFIEAYRHVYSETFKQNGKGADNKN